MAVEASGDPNLLCGSGYGDDGRVTLKQHPTFDKNQGLSEVRKRALDYCKSSHISVKKSKLCSYDDDDDDDEDDDIEEYTIELENKTKQVGCIKKINEVYKKMQKKIEECVCDFVTEDTLHSLMEGLVRECELQLKKKEVETHQVMHNMNKELEGKEEELEVLFQKIAQCTEELKTKEEELDAIKKLIVGQAKELESERKKLDKVISTRTVQMKEFESMKKQLEGRIKELESIQMQLEGRVKDFNLKEEKFRRQVKVVQSKFGIQARDLESKRKDLEGQLEQLKSKEKQLKGQEKELESKNKHFDSLEKELKSKEKQLEGRLKELESKEKQLEDRAKEFELKKEEFESQVEELDSKERIEKQHEVLVNSFEVENELDEPESLDNVILIGLRATSDPSKVVLDIIQKPIVPRFKNRYDDVIIDSGHIFLLEQLLRISPHIKPHVREEALQLALDLKANMTTNTKNSLEVLGFLLLLSIYGLVPSFDEDEIVKLFEFASQHKQAVELFQTLGFADKISAFVENLINKQQYIEAVRFICAYKLVDKNQPVDLLREYVQNAKLISEISCKNTNSLEIKDKVRDEERATLTIVLQCISDNNLECEELLDEIEDRILELNKKKDYFYKMEEDWKPKLDMVFDSFEDAWKFWVDYGRRVGFRVRKQYTHGNKDGSILSCRFVCCKEGLRKPDKRDYETINARPDTRTDCKARLGLKNMCGKLVVHGFIQEHNHILHPQETIHMLSSQRKVSEIECYQIDLADDSGLHQRKGWVESQLSKRMKFAPASKSEHPRRDKGLRLRPDKNVCSHYSCKFAPACNYEF